MVARFGIAGRPVWLSLGALERAVSATCEDIASLLPSRWKDKLIPRPRAVLLEVSRDAQVIDAVLPDGRRMKSGWQDDISELQVAAKRHPVVLRLSDAEILSTVLKLPRRAVSRLDEVVATNIPVWTPFAADDLYFDAHVSGARVAGDDARRPTCDVELRCVPKAALASRFSALAGRSITVDELWLGSDKLFFCDLGSRKTQKARRKKRAALALFGLAMVQACALSVIHRMHQDERIAILQDDLEHIRHAVHARAARAQSDKDAARTLATIEARATGQDSMGYALKRLAAVLPMGARYTEINMISVGSGSLTIVSDARIDPVNLVAATGLLTVTEVNETNDVREADHIYAVAFKTVRPAPDAN